MNACSVERTVRFFGILTRKQRWGLSGRVKWTLLFVFLLAASVAVATIHPFLSPNDPVEANILIIEGWAPPWAMKSTAEEYRKRPYDYVLIVRSVLDPERDYDLGWSSADYAVAALAKNDVPSEKISQVLTVAVHKDRTFHSALGAKRWLATNKVEIAGVNVATIGAHARRSRLLYRRAFGPGIPVGSISLEPREYDKERWWRYSEGVQTVIGESVGYIYARFLFAE